MWGKYWSRHLPKEDIQIANELMKKCSTVYVIRELQSKTKMRYYYTHIRIAKIQNTGNTKCCKDVEQHELSFTAGGNAKWYSHFKIQYCDF